VLGIGFALGDDTAADSHDSIEVVSRDVQEPQSTQVEVAASEPSRVDSAIPEPTDLELVDEINRIGKPSSAVDPAEIESTGAEQPDLSWEETAAPETVTVVEEPPPLPQKRKPKAKAQTVRLVVQRGFVDHAEIRIGGGIAKVVPGKGALNLEIRTGRRRVQWRTDPNGKWHSMFHDFEANMRHACLVGGGTPRFGADPEGSGSR